MKYLGSLEVINFALDLLKAETREQVKVEKMSELTMMTIVLREEVDEIGDVMLENKLDDVISAISIPKTVPNLTTLSLDMKKIIVDGFLGLKAGICERAYDYYATHDFEPTEEIIPLMRDVVKYREIGGF